MPGDPANRGGMRSGGLPRGEAAASELFEETGAIGVPATTTPALWLRSPGSASLQRWDGRWRAH